MNHGKKKCFECRIAKETSVYAVQRGIETHDAHSETCRRLRNVRNFSSQNQCPCCMKYWMEGIVYCDCGTCLVLKDIEQ